MPKIEKGNPIESRSGFVRHKARKQDRQTDEKDANASEDDQVIHVQLLW